MGDEDETANQTFEVAGLLAGFAMMGLCYYNAVRYNWPVEEIFQWGKLWRAFKDAAWALTLPFIILGGIFGGVVTATEGAALAVVAALFVGLVIYRELDVKHLRAAVMEGGVQTAVVMLLVATPSAFVVSLTGDGWADLYVARDHRADLFFENLSDQVLHDDVFARLLTFPNVIITSHQAFFTHEALTTALRANTRSLSEADLDALRLCVARRHQYTPGRRDGRVHGSALQRRGIAPRWTP